MGAVGIEENPILMTGWFTSPNIPFVSDRIEGGLNLASFHHHRLSCPGVVIADEICHRVYPNGTRHDGDQAPPKLTEPLQLFNYTSRRYGIYGMIGQLNGQLVESKIQALQDVSLEDNTAPVYVSSKHFASPPTTSSWAEASISRKVNRYETPVDEATMVRRDLSPGDYVGCYPEGMVLGGAHYLVSGDITSLFQPKPTGFSSAFTLNTPRNWQASQSFDYSIFYSNGGSLPSREASDYQKVVSFLGFHQPFPAIRQVVGGELLPSPVIATIESAPERTVRFSTVRNAEDPIGLTVRIGGFNPDWQTAYRLNGSRKWRYFGELDGFFYMNLYTNTQDHTVMAGHPILADRDGIRITLDDPEDTQSVFELYNPTDEAVRVNLRSNPDFFEEWSAEAEVGPHESKRIRVASSPVP